MEILKYVKYCLSLFEECTINGLGTFRFTEAPPERDTNDNLIKRKFHVIAFLPNTPPKPRLVNIIAGKEGCSIEQASFHINRYVEAILSQLNQNKEVWISEIGLLKRDNDRTILLSHKFPVKVFKNNLAHPSRQPALAMAGTIPADYGLPDKADLIEFQTIGETTAEPEHRSEPVLKERPATSFDSFPNASAFSTTATAAALSVTPNANNGGARTNSNKLAGKQRDVVTSGIHRLKLYPPGLPLKIIAFSKKYMVHIAIAVTLLIATIVSISFYLSERKDSSLNAGASITNVGNETNDPQVTSEPENNQFGEAFKNRQVDSRNDKNPATIAKTKAVNEKNNPLLPANEETTSAVANENSDDLNAPSSDHMPVSATESDSPGQNNPVPVIPVITAPVVPEKKEPVVVTDNAVLTEPEFPGGEKAIDKFIRNKVQYPDKALEEGISGSVKLSFSVDEQGNVVNPVVLQGLGGGCNEEAIRVIKKMPKWAPATRDGNPIPFRKTIKITFKQASK